MIIQVIKISIEVVVCISALMGNTGRAREEIERAIHSKLANITIPV